MKSLILYAYYETDDARRNLGFFCRHGVSPDRDRQHVVVINGSCTIEDQIPKYENVTVLRRPNTGFDFGAWAHALRNVKLDEFDYFFFLNSSVTGPFLPPYQDSFRWPASFVTMLNREVKLAGMTIDLWDGSPIVHSMLLVTDKVGLDLLIRYGIFADNDKDSCKEEVIHKREIRTSKIITECGFRVDSLDLIHSRRSVPLIRRSSSGDGRGDVFRQRAYVHEHTVEPLDLVFFKTNRGLSADALKRSIQLADYKRSVGAYRCFQNTRIMRTLDALKRVPSAWRAHLEFAVWLTCRFLPQIVVDLGVDYGCSTYAWGASGVSQVIGVDWFKGDAQTGVRDTQQAVSSLGDALIRDHQYPNSVRLWRTTFEQAAKVFDRRVDVLHVDGLHTHDAIKRDLENWLPKLAEDGVVVMHGISALPNSVGKVFEEQRRPKMRLDYSTGLGILSKDQRKIDAIDEEWKRNISTRGSEFKHAWFDDLRIQP